MLVREIEAAMAAARKALDATSYGSWVSDEKLKPVVIDALQAARDVRVAWEAEQAKKD